MHLKCLLSVIALFALVREQLSLKIAVIGANGRTGSRCVSIASKKGAKVTAITRSGFLNEDNVAKSVRGVNLASADVKDLRTLATAFKGCDAVIFAASASKEGGTASQIDNLGLVNCGKACLEAKVKRIVVVSSGAVSKPFSPVYLFLNLFGGIMKQKITGENSLKKLCRDSKLQYTIIRPGGLTLDDPLGPKDIELNQGDDVSGRISRWDVASLAVESIYSRDAADTTFECYNRNTGQTLANVGLSNILKKTKGVNEFRVATGKERNGKTWQEMFRGLEKSS